MPSKIYRTTAATAASAIASSSKYASKAIIGLGRWATTDHTGSAKLLANLPPMGFLDTLSIILVQVVATVLGALVSGFILYLLIAHGIPALFSF